MVKRIILAMALMLSVASARAQEPEKLKFRVVNAICQSYQGSWRDSDKVGTPAAPEGPVAECTIYNDDSEDGKATAECTLLLGSARAEFSGKAGMKDGDPVLEVHAVKNPDAVIQVLVKDGDNVLFRFFNVKTKKGIQCFGGARTVEQAAAKQQTKGIHKI